MNFSDKTDNKAYLRNSDRFQQTYKPDLRPPLLFALFSWHLYSSFVLYPEFDKASSYPPFTELNISSLDEFRNNLSTIEIGNCFNIPVGWFEEVWIYDILSLGFLYGRYVPSDKLNVTSKK